MRNQNEYKSINNLSDAYLLYVQMRIKYLHVTGSFIMPTAESIILVGAGGKKIYGIMEFKADIKS